MLCLEEKLSVLFGKWGIIVYRYPVTVILLSLIISLGFGYFALDHIQTVNDLEKLYTPPVCIVFVCFFCVLIDYYYLDRIRNLR